MGITARYIDELIELIVKYSIRIVRHRYTFDHGHFRRIKYIDGIRFATRDKGEMTRGIDDDSMCRGLFREQFLDVGRRRRGALGNRRQGALAEPHSIYIAGTFTGDEQLVIIHRQIIEYREHAIGRQRYIALKYQAGGLARCPGI